MLKFLCVSFFVTYVLAANKQSIQFFTADKKYYLPEVELPFIEAFAICKRFGWILAVERSKEDTKRINAALTTFNVTSRQYYLGGFYHKDFETYSATWMWLDLGRSIHYRNWYRNPTAEERKVLKCLLRQPVSGYSGQWLFDECNTPHYFICQKV